MVWFGGEANPPKPIGLLAPNAGAALVVVGLENKVDVGAVVLAAPNAKPPPEGLVKLNAGLASALLAPKRPPGLAVSPLPKANPVDGVAVPKVLLAVVVAEPKLKLMF